MLKLRGKLDELFSLLSSLTLSPSYREARILSRRKRIQDRFATMQQGDATGTGKEGERREEAGKGKQQIVISKRRLFGLKLRTDQEVTSIRVAGDDREQQHRIQEEQTRQDLRAKLLAEAEKSARQNAAVAMKWADLFSIEVPQELYEQIEKQRQACERIISSKDKLILDIKNELKKKDDEFVKTLKRQAEDTDTLLQYMSRQFVEMQAAYNEELEEIESAFLQERSDLLSSNQMEIQDLSDKRTRLEQEFMDRYLSTVERYQLDLENLRIQDAEDYHILKIRLETDIQNLEQHLEAMRATYQLNTEKLEYNYRVLVERDHENQATINQQKRKISRQRDVLSALKQKYQESEKKFLDENMKLTDEYKRITEQFKDLQGKFRHFEAVDTKKYAEVWAMKEAEVAKAVKNLLSADKILHEQQMGWQWRPPHESVFSLMPTASEEDADGQKQGEGDGEEVNEEEVAAKKAEEELHRRIRDPKNYGALSLLCDEGGFLLDIKTRAMLDKLTKDEAGQVKAESVLRALGVVDGPSFDSLLEVLSADSNIELKAKGLAAGGRSLPTDIATRPGAEEGASTILVHPDDVIRRLKAFIDVEGSSLLGPSAGAVGAGNQGRAVAGSSRRVAEAEREFWERMANVVGEKGSRVWGVLEKQMDNYRNLLQDRSQGLGEVESLQHQNNELRALLNQYLGSRINGELVIPPTVLI